MTIKQVGFEDLLNKTDSKSKDKKSDNKEVKTSSAKSSAKNTKTTMTSSAKTSTSKTSSTKASSTNTKTRKATPKNPASNKKNSKTDSAAVTRKSSPKRVSLSQDDMDKLCEIYDWYLLVKDLAPLKKIKLSDKSTKINLENDIVKESKRISINIDKEIWEDFDALCSNIGQKKNEVLTQVIKDFINDHKDLV